MDAAVCALIDRGLARSTLASYETGKRRYLTFCKQFQFPPLPTNETTLLRFVAHLASSSLCYQTVRLYLCAVRHLQIANNMPDPSLSSYPRLNYALRGLRRDAPRSPSRTRLPVTPDLLHRIYALWSRETLDYDHVMLWAAFCLGFFGFMRSGEFTCPSMAAYTSDMLSPQDVAVDSHTAPSHMTVLLKRTKNDPFAVGTTLHLGATGRAMCPVTSMMGYLAIRPQGPGPLFIFKDGSPLSRPRLTQALQQALTAAGVDCSGYTGHSFRIGAATTAAKLGISDSLIKTLGRWKSAAFTLYIRTPWQQLAEVSSTLVTGILGDKDKRSEYT